MLRKSLAGTAAIFLMAGAAEAGLIVKSQGDAQESKEQTLYIDSLGVRQDMTKMSIIFRSDKQLMWMVDPAEHKYHEMTKSGMDELKAQRDAMMQQIPPEQRERMMAMMGGGQESKPATYRQTGPARTIGKYSCTPYQMTKGNDRSDMCLARLSDVGVSRADIEPMRKMMEFARSLAGAQAPMPDFDEMSKAVGFDPFPIETSTSTQMGMAPITWRVISVDHGSVSADKFEVPAGYTKEEMPSFGPGGGMHRGMPH